MNEKYLYLTRNEIDNLATRTREKVYDVLSHVVIDGDRIVHAETGEILDRELYDIYEGRVHVRRSRHRASNYENNYRKLKGTDAALFADNSVIDEVLTESAVRLKAERMANMCKLYGKCDPFIYLMYEPGRFPQFTNADLGRLLYLGTFVAWGNGRLQHSNGVAINQESLLELIRMSTKRGREFIKKLIAADILNERAGFYFMNPTIFYYGKLKNAATEVRELSQVRIYRSALRSFFDGSDGKAAAQLGIIFALLPYLNKETNMLCHNTGVSITTTELSEMLGYANSTKLRQAMARYEADGQSLFMFHKNPLDRRQAFIELNKAVVNGGGN